MIDRLASPRTQTLDVDQRPLTCSQNGQVGRMIWETDSEGSGRSRQGPPPARVPLSDRSSVESALGSSVRERHFREEVVLCLLV
jgi:hypothetical protein